MTTTARRAAWLIEGRGRRVFTVEQLTDEHRLIAQTADEFVDNEVAAGARSARAEGLGAGACARAGGAASSGCSAPTFPRHTAASISTRSRRSSSARRSAGARRSRRRSARRPGSRSRRSLCFGTEEQKQKYLPRLVTGEIIGAYALSESGSAPTRSARGRARRAADGSYVLTARRCGSPTAASPTSSSCSRRSTASSSPPSSSSAGSPASAAARKSTRWACTARRRRR